MVPTPGTTLGTARCGLFCELSEPQDTDLHVMDKGPSSIDNECPAHPMKPVASRVPLSTLESDHTLPSAPDTLPNSSHDDHPELAGRHLVPQDTVLSMTQEPPMVLTLHSRLLNWQVYRLGCADIQNW